MRRDLLLSVGVGIALATPLVHALPETHQYAARDIIVEDIDDEYDFVVVGGGLAGLVLGGRLSEDSNHTVLVLEAGGNGDAFRERIDTPSYAYFKSLWPTELNWNFNTTPQAGANGNELPWPRGKVLGGSSAINGLYMNRPAELEVNAWKDMLGSMDGADQWSWDEFFAAMKKSETFTPPSQQIAEEAGITWNAASHGDKGPIHMSYPGYTFPLVGQWSNSAATAGVPVSHDTYGGQNWGTYVATSCINPSNWTRSYSRSGYLDPLPPRPNYAVMADTFVTRILFNSSSPQGNLTANAVEYTRDGGATKQTVKVKKEVILAGGTIGSPAVLMHSGVGPKNVLAEAGVPLVHELPGVGQHLQDHLSSTVQFSTDEATAGSIYDSNGTDTFNPAFLSYINSAVAYAGSEELFGDGANALQTSILSQRDNFAPTDTDATVVTGYNAIYGTLASRFFPSSVGQVELLIGNNLNNTINIGAAIQHPYSQGSITINTTNPLDSPVINPNYLMHPADIAILREGMKLVRRIGETEPLSNSLIEETYPGQDVQTDDEWDDFLRDNVFTEFHPSSTCAMLPLTQGGVVDAHLRVYGLANVRVADASVPPVSFSAHLMVSTYGVAEQASNIIRAYHNQKIETLASTNSTQHGNATESPVRGTANSSATAPASTTSSASGSQESNGAGHVGVFPYSLTMLITLVVALFASGSFP